MIGEHYQDKWTAPIYRPMIQTITNGGEVSKAEFDELKKEVLEMKELLKRALKYDTENGEPHCETEEKVAMLKKVAEAVGVDIEEVFKK